MISAAGVTVGPGTPGPAGKPGAPSPAQLDTSQLPDGDFWQWTCEACGLVTQGGRAGLASHQATVHPPGEPQ